LLVFVFASERQEMQGLFVVVYLGAHTISRYNKNRAFTTDSIRRDSEASSRNDSTSLRSGLASSERFLGKHHSEQVEVLQCESMSSYMPSQVATHILTGLHPCSELLFHHSCTHRR
jgi:hypothetical protein